MKKLLQINVEFEIPDTWTAKKRKEALDALIGDLGIVGVIHQAVETCVNSRTALENCKFNVFDWWPVRTKG